MMRHELLVSMECRSRAILLGDWVASLLSATMQGGITPGAI